MHIAFNCKIADELRKALEDIDESTPVIYEEMGEVKADVFDVTIDSDWGITATKE